VREVVLSMSMSMTVDGFIAGPDDEPGVPPRYRVRSAG
jgi:hypothetical protein